MSVPTIGKADPIIAVSVVSISQRWPSSYLTVTEEESRHGGNGNKEQEIWSNFVFVFRSDKVFVLYVRDRASKVLDRIPQHLQ